MTQEERDLLEGRVNRELREAESELARFLILAEKRAADIASLSKEITDRVKRARDAGMHIEVVGARMPGMPRSYTTSDAGIERLKDYASAVDLDAIQKLDHEIGHAVAKLEKARQQKQQLGI